MLNMLDSKNIVIIMLLNGHINRLFKSLSNKVIEMCHEIKIMFPKSIHLIDFKFPKQTKIMF